MEKYCTTRQATDDNMVHMLSCCISKVTNTHTEYVTLIAFPIQQWLYEHASMFRYTYIACRFGVYLQPIYKPDKFVAIQQTCCTVAEMSHVAVIRLR
jgi:hypothetical protein